MKVKIGFACATVIACAWISSHAAEALSNEEALANLRPAVYTGPKVTIIGDSYSTWADAIPEGYVTYYPARNTAMYMTQAYWYQFIVAVDGYLEVNNSWSGSCVCTGSTNGTIPMIADSRLNNLGDPDVILLCAGTNDSFQRLPRGTEVDCFNPANWTEANLATFRPAFAYLLNWLKTNKPGAQVIVIVNQVNDAVANKFIDMHSDYANDIKEIADHYGVMSVQLENIEKYSGHPNTIGMMAIAEQLVDAYFMTGSVPGAPVTTRAATGVLTAAAADEVTDVVETAWGMAYKVRQGEDMYQIVKVTVAERYATVVIPAGRKVEYLAVGGGGSGGSSAVAASNGGGGAGGLVDGFIETTGETKVNMFVGKGGQDGTLMSNGGDTRLRFGYTTAIVAKGGGAGAAGDNNAGRDGGSGGGGAQGKAGGAALQLDVGGLGHAGAAGAPSSPAAYGGGGGGGAGGEGTVATSSIGGCGGDAVIRYVTGEKQAYAGGGTGWKRKATGHGVGGSADGITVGGYLIGTTSAVTDASHESGVANTGSGGAANNGTTGGKGGDGIVVLRYLVDGTEPGPVGPDPEDPGDEPGTDPEPPVTPPEESEIPEEGLLSMYDTIPVRPKVTVIGDSYSTFQGTQPDGYAVYYKDGKNGISSSAMTYWGQFIAAIGGTLEVNNAWSGSFVSMNSGSGATPMVDASRLNNLGDPDIILLFGGTNDAWNNVDRGEGIDCYDSANWSAENLKKFRPAYAYLVHWLRQNKPKAQIVAVVNSTDDVGNMYGAPGLREGYANDIREIAAHYGVLSVQLEGISKSDAHPDIIGHTAICEQLIKGYCLRQRAGEPLAESASGSRSAQAATVLQKFERPTDWGYSRVIREGEAYYQVVSVTNPQALVTWNLPGNTLVEFLAVGGGAAGGSAGLSASISGGSAGQVVDGFYRTTEDCEALVKVGLGGEPTTGTTVNLGGSGTATFLRLGNADLVEAAGGACKPVQGDVGYGGTGGDGAGGAGSLSTAERAGSGGAAVLRYTTGEKRAYAGGGTGWKRSAQAHGEGGSADGIAVGGYLIGTSSSVTDASHKDGVRNTGSGGAAGSIANGNFFVGRGAEGIAVLRYEIEAPEDPGENPGSDPEDPGTDPEDPGSDPEDPVTPPEEPEEPISSEIAVGDEIEINGSFENETVPVSTDTSMRTANGLTEGWVCCEQTELGFPYVTGREAYISPIATTKYGANAGMFEGCGTWCVTLNRQSAIEREISIPVSGTYDFSCLYRSRGYAENSKPMLRVFVDGVLAGEAGDLSKSKNEDSELKIAAIPIAAGKHRLRIATFEPTNGSGASADDAIRIDNLRLTKGEVFWGDAFISAVAREEVREAAVEIDGSRVCESWGTHYQVTRGGVNYQVVCVTEAGADVSWKVPSGTDLEVLAVGGGGAGGANGNRGGGGGAGAVVWTNYHFGASATLRLRVGEGGTGYEAYNRDGRPSWAYANGRLLACALGGGGGGMGSGTASSMPMAAGGGSGGGASTYSSSNVPGESLASSFGGLGNSGGSCDQNKAASSFSGGGGGAGGCGDTAVGKATLGHGGEAVSFWTTGEQMWYAAGGGGAAGGLGGHSLGIAADGYPDTLGGSGFGGRYANSPVTDGKPNTGSGGGGTSGATSFGKGAEGIVVLRYALGAPKPRSLIIYFY